MFTMETQQALRALVALADADDPLVLSALARAAHAPAPALAKILARLSRHGLVVGQRGPGGGYRLARGAGDIRLSDIITPIQGTAFARTCLFGLPHCSDTSPCPLHSTWGAVRSKLVDMIESETLASLRERSAKGTPAARGRTPSAKPRVRAARRTPSTSKRSTK